MSVYGFLSAVNLFDWLLISEGESVSSTPTGAVVANLTSANNGQTNVYIANSTCFTFFFFSDNTGNANGTELTFNSFTSTLAPTATPTESPTGTPSATPSAEPSAVPSEAPSSAPSAIPSLAPSALPSPEPSRSPSAVPSATPTSPSAAPTGEPTREPTAAPTRPPTGSPTTTAPTVSPTNPSSAVELMPNRTTALFPPGSSIALQVRSSVSMWLSVTAISSSAAGCTALDGIVPLAFYDFTPAAPLEAGSFAVNLTAVVADRAYGVTVGGTDRDVFLCHNGTWKRSTDVCRSLNVTNVAATAVPGPRTVAATLCHFSAYMIGERVAATRTCITDKHGCLCKDDSAVSTMGALALSAGIVFSVTRSLSLIDAPVHMLFEIIQAVSALVLWVALTGAAMGYDMDPDTVPNLATATALATAAFVLALFCGCTYQYHMRKENPVAGYTQATTNKKLVQLSACSAFLVLLAVTIVASKFSALYSVVWPLMATGAVLSACEPLVAKRRTVRLVIRSAFAICFITNTVFAARAPCGTSYKGPVA